MCITCLKPGGTPNPELAELIRHWYSLPGNSAGGMLHVQLDDFNLDDGYLRIGCDSHCGWHSHGPGYDITAQRILDELRPLSYADRAATVWTAEGIPLPSDDQIQQARDSFLEATGGTD